MTDKDKDAKQPPSLAEIAEFIRVVSAHMKEAGLAAVEVKASGAKVRLRFPAASNAHLSDDDPGSFADAPSVPGTLVELESQNKEHFLLAPMIGTFYVASAPGEAPFVRTGDRVESGQTIGIIEAMKILNEITADRGGVVEEILVKNAEAVEYGQQLMRIVPDGA